MTDIRAIIRWLSPQEGGRSYPPTDATGYCCPPRFADDPQHTLGMWSLRLLKAKPLGPMVVEASIDFVMAEAPRQRLLIPGSRFELMEGRKVVARGVVLPAGVAVPEQVNDFEVALLA